MPLPTIEDRGGAPRWREILLRRMRAKVSKTTPMIVSLVVRTRQCCCGVLVVEPSSSCQENSTLRDTRSQEKVAKKHESDEWCCKLKVVKCMTIIIEADDNTDVRSQH
jgi:hypothetical protein